MAKRVVVGLSGGVDSSVSLILLKERGFQPIGVSLRYAVWKSEKNALKENFCCSEESFRTAEKVCRKLKVPYHIIDCYLDFEEKVAGYFLSVLREYKTPSPCLICNRFVKFAKLFEFAKEQGIDYVATGHYARVRRNEQTKKYELLRGKDKQKDQSYFLCLLNQRQLGKIIFPLGDYTKKQVYQIAKKQGLNFFEKQKQSQDICFIAKKSIPFYLEEKIGLEPGDIIDKKGNILGRHQGLFFYTIGQRKGIGLSDGPWWIIGFNKVKNQLIATNKENDPALFARTVVLSDVHFISGKALQKTIKVKAKIRYNQPLAFAKLYTGEPIKLVFDKLQRAVTPGQWAVFYDKDICLGGGVIQ